MGTISNIVAGKPLATGGVLIAPTGTAAPTNTSTALNAAFKAAGFIGEDGVTETTDRSTSKVKAWGGSVVKVLQTDYSVTYKFTFIEALNGDVLKAVYGDGNVTTTPPTVSTDTLQTIKLMPDTLPHKSFVFEIKDGLARIRIYVPDGQITEVGDVVYNDGEIGAYQVTVEAFYNEAAGANALKFTDDGVHI